MRRVIASKCALHHYPPSSNNIDSMHGSSPTPPTYYVYLSGALRTCCAHITLREHLLSLSLSLVVLAWRACQLEAHKEDDSHAASNIPLAPLPL